MGKMLIYVFGNGFEPEPGLCAKLIVTWVLQDFLTGENRASEAEIERICREITDAEKFAFSIPGVPSMHWKAIVGISASDRVQRMHGENRCLQMIFEKERDPAQPDAFLAVVPDADEEDLAKARKLYESKEI